MSDLYAIGYDDLGTAMRVREQVMGLQKQHLIDLADAVVVENRDGKIKLHQAQSTAAAGAAGGALWGGVIGLLFLSPLLGMAIGAGFGALGGSMADIGVEDNFMREVGRELEPGHAALFLLVREMTEDKVVPQLAPYGGRLIRSSLSSEGEARLKEMVVAARAQQAA